MKTLILTPDIINGIFEIVATILMGINVLKLYKEKSIKGIYWPVQGFFTGWGIFNLFYFNSLNQKFSFIVGIFLSLVSIAWTLMAAYYSKGTQNERN